MNDWYQLRVQIPFVGPAFAGWLYTDQIRAFALAAALKTCPGGAFSLLDKNGNQVLPTGGIIPGLPGF